MIYHGPPSPTASRIPAPASPAARQLLPLSRSTASLPRFAFGRPLGRSRGCPVQPS